MHFLQALISVNAVITLAIWVYFLFSLIWSGWTPMRTGVNGRAYGSIVPFLFFLLVFVVAFIAWVSIVFA